MIDIRKQSFQALEKITLPESLDRIHITIPARELGSNSSFNPVTGYFSLDNGININIPSEIRKFDVEFIDKDMQVHNVNKWFAYSNYQELKNIVETAKTEPGLARDIDYAYFDVFTQIVDALASTHARIKSELFSQDVVKAYMFYNEKYFVGAAIGHMIDNDYINLNGIYSQTYMSVYEIERLFGNISSQPYKLISQMFNSVSIEAHPMTKWGELDSTDNFFQARYRGYTYGLPAELLTSQGVRVGRCIMTDDLVVLDTNVSTNLPTNIFGRNFRRIDAEVYVSSEALSDAVFHNSCDECGDDINVVEQSFVDSVLGALPEGRDRDNIAEEFETYYTTDGYEDLCPSCHRRLQRTQQDLQAIGIQLQSHSKFTYKDTTYHLMDGSGIHDYDYKPDDFELFYLPDESPTDLMLGVELEVDDGGENSSSARYITSVLNKDIMSEYTYCMHDGSLSDGFEIATMPSSLLFHMNKVNYQDAFKLAATMGYRSHDTSSCGLHVHMNRRFFGSSRATQNIKAAFMALILERNWDEVVKFSRRNYRHIEEWANKKGLEYEVNAYDTTDDIASKFLDSYDDKYVSLNTQHRNSFELRIFRGTLRHETYIATLQFVSNLAHIAKSCTTLTRAQQISFSDIINYQRYPELTNYLSTRGMFVESDDAPVIEAQPTLFEAAAQ